MAVKLMRRRATRRRAGEKSTPRRIANAIVRIAKLALTDEDTYVFGGIAGMGAGVALVAGAGYGLIAASVAVTGFGIWLGYWRLSARPGGDE